MSVNWLARASQIYAQGVEPRKVDLRNRGSQVENAIDALFVGQVGSTVVFQTKAEIDANLGYLANSGGHVYDDPTSSNNGIYKKSGGIGTGTWTKIADFPGQGPQGEKGDPGDDGLDAEAIWPHNRPGERPDIWTADFTGLESDLLAPLSSSLVVVGSDGKIVRITGTGNVLPRRYLAMEPSRVYFLRAVFRRQVNPSDPAADFVRFGVHWFDQSKNFISGTTLAVISDLTVASGRREVSALVSRTSGTDIIQSPSGARYCRVLAQTLGTTCITDIEVLDGQDVTDSTIFAPDLTSLQDEVNALNSLDIGPRLVSIEGQLAGPVKLTYLTEAAAAAETIPSSVEVLTTLGKATFSDGLGDDFVRTSGSVGLIFTSADGAQWKRRQRAVILSAATTRAITNADNGRTIRLGGNALYTVTFPATSTLDDDFTITLINEDGWTSGRGKRIISTSGDFEARPGETAPTSYMMYPGHVSIVRKINGVLRRMDNVPRARLPSGIRNFRVNFSSGDDVTGDGLGSGAGAWKTVQNSYYNTMNFFDFSSYSQTTVVVNMDANESGGLAHLSAHALAPGAQGGAAFKINGGGGSLGRIELFHGAVVQAENIVFSNGVFSGRQSYLYLLSGINFGTTTGNYDMSASGGGLIELNNDYVISGSGAKAGHVFSSNGNIAAAEITVNITALQDVSSGGWVVGTEPCSTALGAVTWLNPGNVTGPKWFLTTNHILHYLGATYPGSEGGTILTGAQAVNHSP